MKAIPTIYRGTQFRSRLEARWAEFFDLIGLSWEYEPEGYQSGGLRYLPDFWLPHANSRGKPGGVFFEVKATSPSEGERRKAEMLAAGSGKTVIVPIQSPRHPNPESLLEFVGGDEGWQDSGLQFARCDNCGQTDVGFYSSDEPACPCGKATFNPYNHALESARMAFPNLGRWEAAA